MMEGTPGRIVIGKSVPLTRELRLACRRHGIVLAAVEYQDVDTGFEVFPEVIGNSVRLDIRPFMAFLNGRKPESMVFQELNSRVLVPFDQWFDLGGHMAQQSEVSRRILETGQHQTELESQVRVKVQHAK